MSSIFVILKFNRAYLKFSRKQASKHVCTYTHTLPQCSPASVGLAQARPNERIQIFHEDRSRARSMLLPECSIGNRPRVKTIEVKARVATYFWFVILQTINSRPLTGGTKYEQWLRSLQVEPVMHGMNGTHKRQKSSS